jgi:hypothetical protein
MFKGLDMTSFLQKDEGVKAESGKLKAEGKERLGVAVGSLDRGDDDVEEFFGFLVEWSKKGLGDDFGFHEEFKPQHGFVQFLFHNAKFGGELGRAS